MKMISRVRIAFHLDFTFEPLSRVSVFNSLRITWQREIRKLRIMAIKFSLQKGKVDDLLGIQV